MPSAALLVAVPSVAVEAKKEAAALPQHVSKPASTAVEHDLSPGHVQKLLDRAGVSAVHTVALRKLGVESATDMAHVDDVALAEAGLNVVERSKLVRAASSVVRPPAVALLPAPSF